MHVSARTDPEGESGTAAFGYGPTDRAALLGAVREDIRHTLRTGWIDPSLEAAATSPVFFTAAWSAIRPNIGKSFLLVAKGVRTQAADLVRSWQDPPNLRKRLVATSNERDLVRMEEAARSAHQVTAKVAIVVHALHLAVRRQPIGGTGHEEPPVRRGIPEWQQWMTLKPVSIASRPLLEEATATLDLPAAPATLRLFAPWPAAMEGLWRSVQPLTATAGWGDAVARLRRIVRAGVSTLPHPVELQWMALREKGFTDAERTELTDLLARHDEAMASQALLAAFAWLSFGSAEIALEA
jgi:hypothetical protein